MSETDHVERLKKALTAIKTLKARVEELEQASPPTEPIAIIGLGCRYPGANNPAELWQLLCAGTDAIREVPADRWDIDEFYDPNPQAAGKMLTRYGGFIEGVDQFDPHFFGISPREAVNLDPQQRLLLEVVWEALEQAGYAPDHLGRSLTGVFMGLAAHDYTDLLLEGGLENINAFMGAGNAHSVAVGRVSFLLGLQGPCVAIDTACSSSLVTIHLACQSLHLRECDLALAGGVNLLLTPTISVNHSRAQMLAPDGRCKTFSAAADGFSRADGCGVIVLKRLRDAQRDGDFIWATINGSAVNHDGRTTGLTVPSGPSQQAVVRQALQRAKLEPHHLSYIEAHGTGTSLGDPIEIGALAAVFAPGRPNHHPLYVGSIKTNIGHAETAAGVAGVIKTALALHHQMLPAHLHFDQPNPLINWTDLPFVVPTQATPWAGPERYAGVSSFGFGGTNTHLILASAPAVEPAEPPAETRPLYLLPLSAKSEPALAHLTAQYQTLLPHHPSLADVCYTAGRGRGHYNHRLAVSGRDGAEIAHKLANGQFTQAVCTPPSPPKIAFLFTGQGAQYPEMARELYITEPTFRAAVDHCLTLAQSLNLPVSSLSNFFTSSLILHPSSFNHTSFVQPALFVLEYALAQLWRSWGIEPAVLLGHSVGEVAAACVAGVFSLADGLRLIVARGQLMGNLPENGDMVAVLAPEEKVRQLLQPFTHLVDIAAVNGVNNVVISGEKTAVAQLVNQFQSQNISCTPLSVSHAFHSPLMDAILEPFGQVAAGLTYHKPEVDLVSNVTGRVESDLFTQPNYWVQHIRQPVRFSAGMQHLHHLGIEHFLEIGPKPTLLSLGRRCLPEGYGRWCPSLRPGVPDQEQLFNSLAELYTQGASVNWSNIYTHQPGRRLPLPTTPFTRQRYWVKPPATPANTVPTGVFYQLTWQLAPLLPITPPTRQRFWLVPDQGGVMAHLAQELQEQGHEVMVGDEPQACDHLLYGRVLDWSAEVTEAISHSEKLLQFIQHWLAQKLPGRLWLFTQQSQRVDPAEQTLNLAHTPVWGLGKVMALEHPEQWGGLIDLPAGVNSDLFEQISHHLTTPHHEDLAAFRPSGRFVLRLTPQELPRPAAPLRLDPDGCYLITGGLGALGLQTARWLIKQGARYLVLTGRSGVTRPEQEQTLNQLQKLGAVVQIAAVDVANRPQLAELLTHLPRPLRGVVHAAGVPGSDKLTEITTASWQAVLRPKLLGGWHLHQLTAGCDLQFFVNFSSIASAWGSKGQAHYAAANQFLDGLSQLQQLENRPGLALNWGPWAGGGMATASAQEWLAKSGVQSLNPAANLAVMGAALQLGVAQGVVAQVDWGQFKPLFEARHPRPLLTELQVTEKPAVAAENRPGETHTSLAHLLAGAKNEQEQYQRLVVYVQEMVAAVLGFAEGQKPEVRDGFFEMGLDSLLAVELKNRLAQGLALSLPTNIVFDYPTIHGLATYLAQQARPAEVVAKRPVSGKVDPAGLLAQVLALTEPEVELALAEELTALEQTLIAYTKNLSGNL